jgi:hypothetical protein
MQGDLDLWGAWFDRAWKVGSLVLGIVYLYFKQHTDSEIGKLGNELRREIGAIKDLLVPIERDLAAHIAEDRPIHAGLQRAVDRLEKRFEELWRS